MMEDKTISESLRAFLTEQGAALVGFADMAGTTGGEWPRGAAVAVRLPAEIVRGIADGPTAEYYEAYKTLNARLDGIVLAGERFLQERGYRAYAQAGSRVVQSGDWRSPLPHKTVATRAGLGWIGKCALLVTEEYGSAVRLSSLLTDAPLDAAEPVAASRCGGCTACANACPAGAVKGVNWVQGMERELLFDAARCSAKAKELSEARFGVSATICGKCFFVCPYTKRALARDTAG